MKIAKTTTCVIMVIIMLFAFVLPVTAASTEYENEYNDYIISSHTYPDGIFAVTTVFYHDNIVYEVPGTRAKHVSGATLTISLSTEYSYTEGATASFGCANSISSGATIGVSDFVVATADTSFTSTITGDVGLTQAETCSIKAGLSYTLESDMDPGIYCIAVVFPGKTVTKKIVGINAIGRKFTLWDQTVEYGPQASESYYTLWPEPQE